MKFYITTIFLKVSEHEEEEDEFKFLEALRDMLAPKKVFYTENKTMKSG